MIALIITPSAAKRTKLDWDNVKRKIDCSNSQPTMTTLKRVVRTPAHRPP